MLGSEHFQEPRRTRPNSFPPLSSAWRGVKVGTALSLRTTRQAKADGWSPTGKVVVVEPPRLIATGHCPAACGSAAALLPEPGGRGSAGVTGHVPPPAWLPWSAAQQPSSVWGRPSAPAGCCVDAAAAGGVGWQTPLRTLSWCSSLRSLSASWARAPSPCASMHWSSLQAWRVTSWASGSCFLSWQTEEGNPQRMRRNRMCRLSAGWLRRVAHNFCAVPGTTGSSSGHARSPCRGKWLPFKTS